MILYSAQALAEQSNRLDILTEPRTSTATIFIGDDTVVIRDQRPLRKGQVRLTAGWSFEQFLSSLNSRVFFWPGDRDGPIRYGRNHFEKYKGEDPIVLRVPFFSLMEANPTSLPLFAKCNSGSPRYNRGIPAPRGPDTFVEAGAASFLPGDVVEVTFRHSIHLPKVTEWISAL
jgi:hypothetical protein